MLSSYYIREIKFVLIQLFCYNEWILKCVCKKNNKILFYVTFNYYLCAETNSTLILKFDPIWISKLAASDQKLYGKIHVCVEILHISAESYIFPYIFHLHPTRSGWDGLQLSSQLDLNCSENVSKSRVGLKAPPFKISFLATENWPKIKLKSVWILPKIIHLASSSHIRSLFAKNHM